jgi:hypothetical protein
MPKSETFLLRGQVIPGNSQTRIEAEIDLGSYVNLGIAKGTALRVHSVQVQICDSLGTVPTINASAAGGETKGTFVNTAITTAQVPASFDAAEMPQLNQDYVMFTSSITGQNGNDDADQGILSHDLDIAPQHLSQGYLLAVDTLYMYAIADDAWAEAVYVNFCLECSIEKITQSTAVSLSLSQT